MKFSSWGFRELTCAVNVNSCRYSHWKRLKVKVCDFFNKHTFVCSWATTALSEHVHQCTQTETTRSHNLTLDRNLWNSRKVCKWQLLIYSFVLTCDSSCCLMSMMCVPQGECTMERSTRGCATSTSGGSASRWPRRKASTIATSWAATAGWVETSGRCPATTRRPNGRREMREEEAGGRSREGGVRARWTLSCIKGLIDYLFAY